MGFRGVSTDFLAAQPSFWTGVARLVDLFGVFDSYNESRDPAEADARAMYADWAVVGQELANACRAFRAS